MSGNKKADELKTNKPNNLEKNWLKPEYIEGKQKKPIICGQKKPIICDHPVYVEKFVTRRRDTLFILFF